MFESLFEALQMSFMQRALAATLDMSLLQLWAYFWC